MADIVIEEDLLVVLDGRSVTEAIGILRRYHQLNNFIEVTWEADDCRLEILHRETPEEAALRLYIEKYKVDDPEKLDRYQQYIKLKQEFIHEPV